MTTSPTLSLTATDIHHLMFPADGLPTRPLTLLHAADEIFKQPRMLTRRLGQLILSLGNPYFTVFLFDTHAELWLTQHWNESISKRITTVASAARLKEQIRVTDECLTALLAHPTTAVLSLSMLHMISWDIRHDNIPGDLIEDLSITEIYLKFRGVSKSPTSPTSPNDDESNRQQDPAV